MHKRHMLVCPVCRGTKWSDAYKISRWHIGECGKCGFARIEPLPVHDTRPGLYSKNKVIDRNVKKLSAVQKLSRAFKNLYKKASSRDKGAIFYGKLRRCLAPGSRVLDIGCGDGSFLRVARERFDTSGVEISKYLGDLAANTGLEIFIGDFIDMDLGGAKYDGVTMISLLEHLCDAEKAMDKCYSVLKDNGVLLLKTVNYGSLNRLVRGAKWTGFRPPDHVIYFAPRNLKAFLEGVGFRKVKISAWPLNDNMYCSAWK